MQVFPLPAPSPRRSSSHLPSPLAHVALALLSSDPRPYPCTLSTPLASVVTDDLAWCAFRYGQETHLSGDCGHRAPRSYVSSAAALLSLLAMPFCSPGSAVLILHSSHTNTQPCHSIRGRKKVCSAGSLE